MKANTGRCPDILERAKIEPTIDWVVADIKVRRVIQQCCAAVAAWKMRKTTRLYAKKQEKATRRNMTRVE